MKRITCEMCGSTELLKKDGVFECQNCGTKYTVEEAKKMMVEGTVNVEGMVSVEGTVKIDSNDELKKLYQAARNARKTGDDDTALKHYERINAMDPDSWEALFYLVILKTNTIKNSEISSSAINISNSLERIFQLISAISDKYEQKKAVYEIVLQLQTTTTWLTNASENFYKTVTKGNGAMALTGISGIVTSLSYTGNALNENQKRCFNIANVMCLCGNLIETYMGFEDNNYRNYAIVCWQAMLNFDSSHKSKHSAHLFNDETIAKFTNKLETNKKQYDIDNIKAEKAKKEKYWEEHSEEKNELEEKISSTKKKIENLHNDISKNKSKIEELRKEQLAEVEPLINKMNSISKKIAQSNKEYKSLGLFQSKQKESVKKELNKYNLEKNEIIDKILKTRNKIKLNQEKDLLKYSNKIEKDSEEIDELISELEKNMIKRYEKVTEDTNQLRYIDDEYTCERCGAEFFGSPIKCPECGVKFSYED